MSTIKDITTVTELEALHPEGDTTVYVEHDGGFYRAPAGVVRSAIGLGGIVVVDGRVCLEIDEE